MSIFEVLQSGVSGLADMSDISEMLPSFEGQAVSFTIKGGEVFTFTIKAGILCISIGQASGVRGAAEVSRSDFLSFINGTREFPGLFTHEFPLYFRATVGEYYDFGGDFMLMGPVFDGLSRFYRQSPGFKLRIDGYASGT